MKLTEKIAYMKGMLDGMELDTSTKEGKAIAQMAEVMEEMAVYIDDLQSQLDEVTELCDILDEDLGAVEEDLYCDDDDFDLGSVIDPDDIDYLGEEEDDPQYEVQCPTCGDTIIIDETILEEGSITCPGCGETLDFDYDTIVPSIAEDEDEEVEAESSTEA
ncbi:MAG: hypothetical protein IKL87_03410 [Oscillospiraceae bacterium]|nr:hypothetical protein [Oscillospiraceae bacterium]